MPAVNIAGHSFTAAYTDLGTHCLVVVEINDEIGIKLMYAGTGNPISPGDRRLITRHQQAMLIGEVAKWRTILVHKRGPYMQGRPFFQLPVSEKCKWKWVAKILMKHNRNSYRKGSRDLFRAGVAGVGCRWKLLPAKQPRIPGDRHKACRKEKASSH